MCRWRDVWRWVQVDSFSAASGWTVAAACPRRPYGSTYNREKSSRATPSEASQPIRFAGSVLGAKRHVCAFFHSPTKNTECCFRSSKRVSSGREGVPHRRSQASCGARPATRVGRHRCGAAERAVSSSYATGLTPICRWSLRSGPDARLIQEVLDAASSMFALTRLVAHMEWALEDRPGVDDLVEYETRLNYVLPRYKDPVI